MEVDSFKMLFDLNFFFFLAGLRTVYFQKGTFIRTHFLDLVTEINTNICRVCPVDLELFKWCDYLGQYVLSGFSVCPLILRITELFSTPVSVFLAAGCLRSVRTAFPSNVLIKNQD